MSVLRRETRKLLEGIESAFWRKINKLGPVPEARPDLGPCWLWKACLQSLGYGQIRFKQRHWLAHVVAWVLTNGPVPEGKELDHLCRNPRCCNPAHLEPVTHLENVRRGEGGKHHLAKTQCPQGHPYSGENLYLFKRRDGSVGRYCRACKRAGGTRA